MVTASTTFETLAALHGLDEALLPLLREHGQVRSFAAGDYLAEAGTPRQWFGVIETGQIELIHGRYGDPRRVAVLERGAMLCEGVAVGDLEPHAVSVRAIHPATVLTLTPAQLDLLKWANPEAWTGLMTRVAQRLGARLGLATTNLAEHARSSDPVGSTRQEHDSLGIREVPEGAYYGVQTVRAMENFPISGQLLNQYGHFVTALAMVKKGAAQANLELGVLSKEHGEAICMACDEIIDGQLRSHFVVDMVQGGAGTSTNMNANEVIANRALELLGHPRGHYHHLHPNDHVNLSQSTNDAYPTAVKIAVLLTARETLIALDGLERALAVKGSEFADVLKMGRTENQDAVPMTLGQEFHAYAGMIRSARTALSSAQAELRSINMGATAIGTGLNSPAGYAPLVTAKLVEISGLGLELATDLVESTQDSGAFAQFSGSMKRVAIQISKICNDLRWLSSGPRAGLGEINLPPVQPGSSIMPGKVNPVVPEMVNQVCYQIIGFDTTIGMAAEASELELNMAEPIIAFDLLQGLSMLTNAALILTSRCVDGITANREVCLGFVQRSIGLATALNPTLGYERSAEVAKEALRSGRSVYDLVLERGWLDREQLDDLLDPVRMTNPLQP